ncbi:MAG: hypothetical protein JXQ73_03095 [Phycisphaerae bacterium]|nr:hypothetical protein [Phycisphaerae bacterium]
MVAKILVVGILFLSESGDVRNQFVRPGLVRKMMVWPGEAVQAEKRLRGNLPTGPIQESVDWLRKIVAKGWLASNDLRSDALMMRREHGVLSVVHMRWEKNGYAIEVAQTRAVITFKLTPKVKEPAGDKPTAEQLKKYANEMAMKLFSETFESGMRLPESDDHVVIKDVHCQLQEYSFDCAFIKPVNDGIAATPWNAATFHDGKTPTNRNSSMWWNYVGWWTDGNTVEFWTFKRDGDSWSAPPAPVADPIGRDWF